MKNKKFLLLVTTLLAVLLILTACSNTTEDNNDSSDNEKVDTEMSDEKTDDNETDSSDNTETENTEKATEEPAEEPIDEAIDNEPAMLELTLDQLAEFDGKDGNPAYIAVNGKIYDLSDVPVWSNGDHNGFTAGKDLTDQFPHEESRLDYGVEIGVLVDN